MNQVNLPPRLTRTPWVVYLLILANAAFFLYAMSLSESQLLIFTLRNAVIPRAFFEPVWAIYNGIKPNDYWPFVTYMFMHGGWLHILLNMWALYIFGAALEDRLGHLSFILFYFACGMIAGLTHVYLNRQSSLPLVGASGAVSGLIAAYAAFFPRQKLIFFIFFVPIPIPIPALFFAMAFFVIQAYQGITSLIDPAQGGSIAWWAHIGGFIAGLVLTPFFAKLSPPPPEPAATISREPPKPEWERGPWG